MNLAKLYEAQAKLDADIIEKKGLQGHNLLPNKILALNVELGELAQEVQGEWKYWKEHTTRDEERVLDEFVDCLHFALSIGIELGYDSKKSLIGNVQISKTVIGQFIESIKSVSEFWSALGGWLTTDELSKLYAYENMVENIIELGNMLGFTDDQIEAQYFKKNKVNHERQRDDY
jgi:dimeric dUTPase (all-alpha-NTP-PPase superfamily)